MAKAEPKEKRFLYKAVSTEQAQNHSELGHYHLAMASEA